MRQRNTAVLLVLFAAALGLLWYVDHAKVPYGERLRAMTGLVLPELVDVPPEDVYRIEVDRPGSQGRIVVERREDMFWQMHEPLEAAADPVMIETLVRNLRDLRRSPDSGTIEGDPATYGLATPSATVRIYGKGDEKPRAVLQLGRSIEDKLYVQPGGQKGFEVVDRRLLSGLTLTPAEWRDTAMFHMPSFKVASVEVDLADPKRTVKAERDERRWLLTSPVKTLAENDRVEGLVAELAALRCADTTGGFVADDVKDFGPYGLDKPSMTLRMVSSDANLKPQTLQLGKPVPDKDNQVYARRGDQDDVVRLDVKILRQAIGGEHHLRSQKVVDLTPGLVSRFTIQTRNGLFELARNADGSWQIVTPVKERAETATVMGLLTRLSELKTSEFLAPSAGIDAKLNEPSFHIQVWQLDAAARRAAAKGEAAADGDKPPHSDLVLGRHDRARKVIYGRIAGDDAVLAIPDEILSDLPLNLFAFRERTVLTIRPEQFASVTVERPDRSVTAEAPGPNGSPTAWKITEPVKAPADNSAVTSLLVALGRLQVENWESEAVGDGKAFGLDSPRLRIKWTLQPGKTPAASEGAKGVLRIGKVKPGGVASYANVEGDPRVFSLNPGTLVHFEAELHDSTAFTLQPDKVRRVVLKWPTRTLALSRATGPTATWQVEPGNDPAGFDAARVQPLVAALAALKTPRFAQYDGPISAALNLDPPALVVEASSADEPAPRVLRVGRPQVDGTMLATTSTGDSGAVFVIPGDAFWTDLLKPPGRIDDLPADVFAPAPAK